MRNSISNGMNTSQNYKFFIRELKGKLLDCCLPTFFMEFVIDRRWFSITTQQQQTVCE